METHVSSRIVALLKQGITPEKLALTIALGLAIGVFPAIGWTTLLCTGAAVAWRLNLPAIQTVNYFATPLQLALLVPFLQAGQHAFGTGEFTLSVSQIFDLIQADPWQAIALLWKATLRAIALWAIAAPLFVVAAYAVLAPALRRVPTHSRSAAAPPSAPAHRSGYYPRGLRDPSSTPTSPDASTPVGRVPPTDPD